MANNSHIAVTPNLMQIFMEESLAAAQTAGRFEAQASVLHTIICRKDVTTHETNPICDTILAVTTLHDPGQAQRRLNCLVQASRPVHTSGYPDKLPFRNAMTMGNIFKQLELPAMYLQIADGAPGLSSFITHRDEARRPVKFELVVHCVGKRGDWAIALSHMMATQTTSAFWSMDSRINSAALLKELDTLKDYASHPMLIPCMMLSASLRDGVDRRRAIKSKLRVLEDAVNRVNAEFFLTTQKLIDANAALTELSHSIEGLFKLLSACRKEQASQEGRYKFYDSFHDMIRAGFAYVEELTEVAHDQSLYQTRADLMQWTSLNWHKIESLKARDVDYVSRVGNITDMLFHITNQRDSRVQLAIAQASQQDSEDMKFIAVLGSVFLPASLVASIISVQEFQFAPGWTLFGAYIAISIPLITGVVAVCLARRHLSRWYSGKQGNKASGDPQPGGTNLDRFATL